MIRSHEFSRSRPTAARRFFFARARCFAAARSMLRGCLASNGRNILQPRLTLPPDVLPATCRAARLHGDVRSPAEADLIGLDAGVNRLARLRALDHESTHESYPPLEPPPFRFYLEPLLPTFSVCLFDSLHSFPQNIPQMDSIISSVFFYLWGARSASRRSSVQRLWPLSRRQKVNAPALTSAGPP
jgi:hypothetical protein